MKLVNVNSLAETLDAINEAFFYEKTLSKSQREKRQNGLRVDKVNPVPMPVCLHQLIKISKEE
jgi:hypothetical protein